MADNALVDAVHALDQIHDRLAPSGLEGLSNSDADAYEAALHDLFDASLGAGYESAEITTAVDDLEDSWVDYQNAAGIDIETTSMTPFFAARERVSRTCRLTVDYTPRKLESVAYLFKDGQQGGLNTIQIAKTYDWFDNGRPDTTKVEEELANPGTHVGPDFVPQVEIERDDMLRSLHEARGERVRRKIKDKTIAAEPDPTPEPNQIRLKDLFVQGLTLKQILTHFTRRDGECLVDAQDVLDAATAEGYILPDPVNLSSTRAPRPTDRAKAEGNPHAAQKLEGFESKKIDDGPGDLGQDIDEPAAGSLEELVAPLAAADMSAREIADQLGEWDGKKLSYQRVNAAMKRLREAV